MADYILKNLTVPLSHTNTPQSGTTNMLSRACHPLVEWFLILQCREEA